MLRNLLKQIKLNESTISMVLGVVVVLVVGSLVFNYFQGLNNQPTITDTSPSATGTTETQREVTYVVKAGETLWSIAEDRLDSGYDWVELAKANGIDNPSELEEGRELTLPVVEHKEVEVGLGDIANDRKLDLGSKKEEPMKTVKTEGAYTVVKGDCLWTIAEKEYGDGYRWVDIASANKLENPDLIHPGNVLTLPR